MKNRKRGVRYKVRTEESFKDREEGDWRGVEEEGEDKGRAP